MRSWYFPYLAGWKLCGRCERWVHPAVWVEHPLRCNPRVSLLRRLWRSLRSEA